MLVLWDIDGTLLSGSRLVAETFASSLRETFELAEPLARISYAGKTDPQIAVETLALHGWPAAAVLARLADFRAAYVAAIEACIPHLADQLRPLPGVAALLTKLSACGVAHGLLTGNFAETAHIKLACAGLAPHFAMAAGAYGSDHIDRNCLAPIALAQASRHFGRLFAPAQTIVIGDTPRDIDCARAAGCRVAAVATGMFGLEELAAHGPDLLLADLSATSAAVAALLELGQAA